MPPYDLILSYDISTLKLLAFAEVYGVPVFPVGAERTMTLWGTEGVALTDGSQLVVLSGAFFSTYRGEPTLVLPPSTPLPPSN